MRVTTYTGKEEEEHEAGKRWRKAEEDIRRSPYPYTIDRKWRPWRTSHKSHGSLPNNVQFSPVFPVVRRVSTAAGFLYFLSTTRYFFMSLSRRLCRGSER